MLSLIVCFPLHAGFNVCSAAVLFMFSGCECSLPIKLVTKQSWLAQHCLQVVPNGANVGPEKRGKYVKMTVVKKAARYCRSHLASATF